ncbi:hypothetical protein Ac2012v2_006865 [Leucoagaricus gongylophorus]
MERQVTSQNIPIEEWVIILDGLDEVEGTTAQIEIIRTITTSICERTTPFGWFTLSRPEPHIDLDLPLSSRDDHEILIFFEKELDKIRKERNLLSS